MKNRSIIVISLIFFILGLLSCGHKNSTSNTRCIEFMEIPIEGNVKTFGEKLEGKGYCCNGDDTLSRQIGYDGTYLNKPVQIILYYNEETRDINIVRTWFRGNMPNVASLLNEYTEKYGKCDIKADYGDVFYTWKVEGGYIGIATDNSSFLAIDYSNKELNY